MKEIFAALSKAQSQIRGAIKENTNPHFRSRYADLESVIDAIRKPLADNGLAFMQSVSDGYVRTVIMHTSGEQLESTLPFVGQMPDMQKLSAALTYARRQGLCTAFGVPQVDDDGNSAAEPVTAPVVKKTWKPEPVVSKIPPGLLTDGHLPEEENTASGAEKFDAIKHAFPTKTQLLKEDMERYGFEVKVEELYPLFVEGRDNQLVKSIMDTNKIPIKKLEKHGAALKKYCIETRKETSLHDAVLNFFSENK